MLLHHEATMRWWSCHTSQSFSNVRCDIVGTRRSLKNSGSHIDASHSRQPLVKGERLVRYEVNAVMLAGKNIIASSVYNVIQYAKHRNKSSTVDTEEESTQFVITEETDSDDGDTITEIELSKVERV